MPELGFDVLSAACTSRGIFGDITGRWGALTIAALDEPVEAGDGEGHRFGSLHRRIGGISEKMLSQALKALEADGYVDRLVLSVMPPHVEYRLTESGRKVAVAVDGLIRVLYSTLEEREIAGAASVV